MPRDLQAADQGSVVDALAKVNTSLGSKVPTSRLLSTSGGLLGGGSLAANRSLSLDYTALDARYIPAGNPWQPVSGGMSTLSDQGAYESFPMAATNAAGLTLAFWHKGTTHYTGEEAWFARMQPGATTWDTPYSLPSSNGFGVGGGLAVRGNTFATLEMRRTDRVSRIRFTDDGLTWSAGNIVTWTQLPTAFASGLTWCADGTLYATAYSNSITEITKSTDGGVTWATCWRETDSTKTESALLEFQGKLILYQRHQATGVNKMTARISTDGGTTFTAPQDVLPDSLGLPFPTLMPDGTILMPARYGDARWNWYYAQSRDGLTFTTHPLNIGTNMYGAFAPRGTNTAVLVGGLEEDVGNVPSSSSNTHCTIFSYKFDTKSSIVTVTPTLGGIASLGTGGTVTLKYARNGATVTAQCRIVWGASASITTPSVTLPIPSAGVSWDDWGGIGRVGGRTAYVLGVGAPTVGWFYAGGGAAAHVRVGSSNTPIASGDVWTFAVTYLAAT